MEKKHKNVPSIVKQMTKVVQHDDYEVGDTFCAGEIIRPLVAPNCSDNVVAHAKFGLRQVRYFVEVSLLPHIMETMQKLGMRRLQRLQSYSWPHLSGGNGHGLMIVSASRSGRTFGYIPPLCDLVCRALTAGRHLRGTAKWYPDQEGALALILVPDTERVSQVSALCHALLRKAVNEEWFTLTLTYVASKKVELIHRLLNGVGCLVVTPAQLVALQEEAPGVLRFPRLQFIVFDDIDLMPPEQVKEAERVLKELLPRERYPQLVMVSQSYNPRLMAKLKAANNHPALIFGDILEAAVYGGTRIKIAFCGSENKVNEVFQALQQRPPKEYRTVIYCSHDLDIRRLVLALEKRSHACLPYYQNSNLVVRKQVHRWMAKSQGIILLCTDDCPELNIRHAHTLIHYGMGNTWGKFKMRHFTISGNLKNQLAPAEPNSKSLPLHSLVLLDQENQRQLPRLVDFLQQHQKVEPGVVELVTKMRLEIEKERGNQNALCRQIMVKGSCIDPSCNDRHHINDLDRCHPSVPTSGDVKVKFVKIYSPTHFCVYLVEHLPPQGSWQSFPNVAAQQMRVQLLQDEKPRRFWPPVPGAICMFHSYINERVRVLQVPPIKSENLAQVDLPVLVQAIDLDTRIFTANSGRLYKCPAKLEQLPPMAIDMRLLGLVPSAEGLDWTEEDRRGFEQRFKQLPEDHFLQAYIQFATTNTLFVRNLVALSYVPSLKMHVRNLSLSHVLIAEKLAKKCDETKNKILAFFMAEGEVENAKQKIIEQEVQEVKDQAEDKLGTKQEDQKENVSPHNTTPAPLKGKDKSETLELGKKNLLKDKQEQHKTVAEPPNSDSLAELYDCLMRCSLLDLEDKQQKQSEKHPGPSSSPSPAAFLNHVLNGEAAQTSRKSKKQKKPKETKTAPEPPRKNLRQQIQVQLPPNVARPETSYYQTHTTLELQVLLPEEVDKYAALLEKGQILFWATCKSSELKHQFVLNLSFPYISLSHRQRGRTVYLSVQKAIAAVDPLHFSAYPFMKPNHEMFDKFDDQQEMQLNKTKGYLRKLVCADQTVQILEEEDSYDEDNKSDGVEVPARDKVFED